MLAQRPVADERLAHAVAAGRPGAFARLYQRHREGLLRHCRSVTHDDADAEDALQSAMLRAFTALRTGTRPQSLSAWLYRIARNESIEILRHRRPQRDLPVDLETMVGDPSASLTRREEFNILVDDLLRLPQAQRTALVLHELQGLDYDAIGTRLGISTAAARQTAHAARLTLADFALGRGLPCAAVQVALTDGDGRTRRDRRLRAHLAGCASCRIAARRDGAGRDGAP
jgi:RNA polymerase sigma factor (sigma-70 family)